MYFSETLEINFIQIQDFVDSSATFWFLSLCIKSDDVPVKQEILLFFCYVLFIFLNAILLYYPSFFYIDPNLIGKLRILKQNPILSFVSVVKNEAPYIKEWIEFHKLVGVTRFYIYDNNSEDNLTEILKPYIKSGQVIYQLFPGNPIQLQAYNNAIQKYKHQTKYMGFIDIDEFVIPIESQTLIEPIEQIMNSNKMISGIGINWHIYGSSGFIEKPKGLVIENFRYRMESSSLIKTICDPRKVYGFNTNPHSVISRHRLYLVNEDGIKYL